VNMFAGGGLFLFDHGKHSNPLRVYSIDVNPAAVHFMRENIRINEAYGVVVPMLGDAKKVVEERLRGIADRVLMPLPEKAFEYIPHVLLAIKRTGGLVHYYDFEHAKKGENSVEKVRAKVTKRFESLGVAFDFSFGRVVRPTGSNWYHVVLDISITH